MGKKCQYLVVAVCALGVVFIISSCKHSVSESGNNSLKVYSHNLVTSPDSALELLRRGNERFVKDSVMADQVGKDTRTSLKEKGQHPLAVIVTCSDSRVSPEILFDQGLGDLFVIRVAGNVMDSVGLGSIEYAVEHLHSPLIVVLGHENCGAVKATVEGGELPGSLPAIARRITPSLIKVKNSSPQEPDITKLVETENIIENASFISRDPLIHDLTESGKVKILSAKYHLDTGVVDFLN